MPESESYTIERIKERLYDPNDSIEDILGYLNKMKVPANFSRAYIKLFVSGAEEALAKRWPSNKTSDGYPTIHLVDSYGDAYRQIIVEGRVWIAGFDHENNQILFSRNSLVFARLTERISCWNDPYAKRKLFTEFSLAAGIEEGLHACHYQNDSYTYLKRLDKKRPDVTSYQMDSEEIEAKEEVEKLLEEIGDKYDSLIDELMNTPDAF